MFVHPIQIVLYLFIGYVLFMIDNRAAYKHKMNLHLLFIFTIVMVLALRGEHVISLPYAVLCISVIGCSIWLFLLKVESQSLIINTPIAYLSFYFAALLALLITGTASSLLFPEVFYLAVLFASVNSGRKVSFGVALLSIATIVLLYLSQAPFTELSTIIPYRVIVTSILIVGMVQAAGYIYKEKVKDTKRKQILRWESKEVK